MISAYVQPDGSVAFRCSVCDQAGLVPWELHESPFWAMFCGEVLLGMLAHYRDEHQEVNR